MSGIYFPAYYDTIRRFLVTGDPDLRLTHVGLGSGGDPDATTLTDPHLVPIGGVVMPADQPRKLLVQWLSPAGDATGLVVRELGLVRADGVLLARTVRSPIEKTADLDLGDFWDLDV